MPDNRLATIFWFGHVTQPNLASLSALPTLPWEYLLSLRTNLRLLSHPPDAVTKERT
jgi:hypothetical protein